MRRAIAGLVGMVLVFGGSNPDILGWTYAAYIQWSPEEDGNGHYYGLVSHDGNPIDWHDAKTEAENTVLMGASGHLATVTSQAENDFLTTTFFSVWSNGAWIGLTDEEVEGTWKWVTGEEFDYANWADGEPNNWEDEDCVQYYGVTSDPGVSQRWNDRDPTGSFIKQYFIEFVPEPSTLVLLGMGVAALLAFACPRWQH